MDHRTADELSRPAFGRESAFALERAFLETLALAVGVALDPTRADAALGQAWSEHPDPGEWAERFAQAGPAVGVSLTRAELPVYTALTAATPDLPLMTRTADGGFAVLAGGNGTARLLGRPGEADKRVPNRELVLMTGADGGTEPLTWLSAAPAAPLDPHADHAHHVSPLRRVLRVLRPEKSDLVVVALFGLGIGVLSLGTPVAVEALVNTISFGILAQPLIALAVVLFGVLALAAAMQVCQYYVVEFLQQRLFVRTVGDFAYRLPRTRVDAFDGHPGPELVNRFLDVVTVQKAVSTLLLDALTVVIQAVIGMAVLAFYHPFLLGFDLLLIFSLAFLTSVLGRGAVRSGIEESRAKYHVLAWFEDLARHPRLFKSAGAADFAAGRADRLAREWVAARNRHFRIVLWQFVAALSLQVVANTVLLGLGGWLVMSGEMTLGQLVAGQLIVSLIVGSFAKFNKYLESYYDLLVAVDKLGHVTDLPLEREDGLAPRSPAPGGVALRLSGPVEVELPPGGRLAVTGPAGCGKTHLAEALGGMRELEGGRVELDGLELREWRPDLIHRDVLVATPIAVFEGTVADNLRVGRLDVSTAEMRDALDRVGLLDAVQKLPSGLQTQLACDGGPLSQSQVALLAVARAMVLKPRLLVIDGAFDRLSERETARAADAVFDPRNPWTLVVTTGRPEIAARSGRVVELGRGGE